jgi:hypothetical protein
VKLIVIGVDPATVSCAVIGLTSLLKPLQWVSPMIPIMPLKHMEFLESPVPLVAGMVVDGDHATPDTLGGESITPYSILKLCDDGESVTAVLDLSARDIFVLNSHSEVCRRSAELIVSLSISSLRLSQRWSSLMQKISSRICR